MYSHLYGHTPPPWRGGNCPENRRRSHFSKTFQNPKAFFHLYGSNLPNANGVPASLGVTAHKFPMSLCQWFCRIPSWHKRFKLQIKFCYCENWVVEQLWAVWGEELQDNSYLDEFMEGIQFFSPLIAKEPKIGDHKVQKQKEQGKKDKKHSN
ncbi:hypothetical protein PIB30_020791 [Stylosanthes scabra]|uniref:Uncharacterized protein n=1 Tax=Stylosanthes scabra TaxID=79078 RepID=A0ABU6R956_9FABA|nr:hypothetical protein [Stylosanthes scabra]